jgi:DNA modification methylase
VGDAILRGNALALPLAEQSVDLVVTSPPYFAQRSYTDDGVHYEGQVGGEQSARAYVDALLAATREMVRVLKPTGSIWVNLGDKYCSPGGHTDNTASSRLQGRRNLRLQGRPDRTTSGQGVPRKSLFGIPWRYALRCIDDLGLTLRRDQVWHKPNAVPESCTDRTRTDHEYWFHFTVRPNYYADIDEL